MKPDQQRYSDQPTIHDELGFAPSTKALVKIINGLSLADTPLTIGIFGPWGSGKTSQMRMILDGLDTMQYIPIWFDAWRYAQADALWRALLVSVVESIREYVLKDDKRLIAIIERRHQINPKKHGGDTSSDALETERKKFNDSMDDMIGSLYRSVEREEVGGIEVNWQDAGKVAVRTAIRLGFSSLPLIGMLNTNFFEKAIEKAQEKIGEGEDVSDVFDLFQRERSQIYRDQVCSLEQFYQEFKKLVEAWVIDPGLRLIVFIDDLDRCLPEQAIGVLEAIKVFLDIQGCLFVLGVDREVIERGIRVRYKEFALADDPTMREGSNSFPIAGRDYLDKIVQVPFELPPLEPAVMKAFVQNRLQQQDDVEEEYIESVSYLMSIGLQPNPRKVKRTLNTFRLLVQLGNALDRSPQPGLLAKLVVIQSSFPHVYERVVRGPDVLKMLEHVARNQIQANDKDDYRELLASLFHESYTYFFNPHETGSGNVKVGLTNWSDVLNHASPRLESMMQIPPFFTDLDEDELRGLVFLTRRTV